MEVSQTEQEVVKKKRVNFHPLMLDEEEIENKSEPINESAIIVSRPLSKSSVTEKSNLEIHEITENVPLVEPFDEQELKKSSVTEQLTTPTEPVLEEVTETLAIEEQKSNELIESQLIESPEKFEQLVSQEQFPIKTEPPILRESSSSNTDTRALYNTILKNLRTLFEQYAKLEKSSLLTSTSSRNGLEEDDGRYMNLKEFLLFCKDHSISLEMDSKDQDKQLRTLFKLICTSQGVNFEKFITLLKHISSNGNGKMGNKDLIEAVKVIDQRRSNLHSPQMKSRDSALDSSQFHLRNSSLETSQLQTKKASKKSSSINNVLSKYIYTQKLKNRKTVMNHNIALIDPRNALKANIQKSINELEEENLKDKKPSLKKLTKALKSKLAKSKSTSMEKINEKAAQRFYPAEMIPVELQTRAFINYFINRDFHNIKSVRRRSQSLDKGLQFSHRDNLNTGKGQSRAFRKGSLDAIKTRFKRASSNKSSESIDQGQPKIPDSSFNCSRLAIPLRKPIERSKENNRINLSKNARILHHLNSKKRDDDDLRKFDSYHLREQMKVKSTFLRNITWTTINKMKAEDLYAQMDEKILEGDQANQQITDHSVIKFMSPKDKVQEKPMVIRPQNLKQIINYGKIKKLNLDQNNYYKFRY